MGIRTMKHKRNASIKQKDNKCKQVSLHKNKQAPANDSALDLHHASAYDKCKRLADIILSGTALTVLSPLFAGISIAIKRDGEGPVIFRQTRVGIHKKHFEIYKFRTMYANTPKDMPTHLLQNPDRKSVV